MTKVFIYAEYDLIEELTKLINDVSGSWSDETTRYRQKIREMRNFLIKSTEVMIK